MRNRIWSVFGIGVAVALAGLTVLPASSWIVRQQMMWLGALTLPERAITALFPDVVGENGDTRAAQRHPSDAGMHLAVAGSNVEAIKVLQARFPNDPMLDAALLRALATNQMSLSGRDADDAQLQSVSPITPLTSTPTIAVEKPKPMTPAQGDWTEAAQRGETLDPSNAFFPMMQAVGFLPDTEMAKHATRSNAHPFFPATTITLAKRLRLVSGSPTRETV